MRRPLDMTTGNAIILAGDGDTKGKGPSKAKNLMSYKFVLSKSGTMH